MTTDKLLKMALKNYREGNLDEAEKLCDEILVNDSANPDCFHLIGIINYKKNDHNKAIEYIKKAVALKPDFPIFHNSLGTIYSVQGDITLAIEHHEKVLYYKPDDVTTLNTLAYLYHTQGRKNQTFYCLQKSLTFDPANSETLTRMGDILQEMKQPETAYSCYQKALSINPDSVELLKSIAKYHLNFGDRRKSLEYLFKALDMNPDSISVKCEIARLQKNKLGDKKFKLLEIARRKVALTERIQICFTLGKMYEDVEDFDSAFKYYQEGNELRKKISPVQFCIEDFTARIDTYKELFHIDFFKKYSSYGNRNKKPIFIIGMPRSGTSLVEQVIASHPEAYGAGELDFVHQIYSQLMIKYNGSIGELSHQIAGKVVSDNAHEYIQKLLLFSPDSKKICDKLPNNFILLWLIALMFPDANVIHCTRNPIATCLSCYFTDFQGALGFKNDLAVLGKYFMQYKRLMHHWEDVLPVNIFTVNYESFIENQEKITKDILEYCDLPWNQVCLDFYKTRRFQNTASNTQTNKKLYSSSVARWTSFKKHLGPLVQELEELI